MGNGELFPHQSVANREDFFDELVPLRVRHARYPRRSGRSASVREVWRWPSDKGFHLLSPHQINSNTLDVEGRAKAGGERDREVGPLPRRNG